MDPTSRDDPRLVDAVRSHTDLLLGTARALDDATAPSLCVGWSRGLGFAPQCGRYTALRPARGALVEQTLRDDRDGKTHLCGVNRCRQPGNARSQDDEVKRPIRCVRELRSRHQRCPIEVSYKGAHPAEVRPLPLAGR